jgi:hypothetical protein
MPAKERVGFEDEQSILPVLDETGEKDEPESIGWRKGGLADLTVKDDELLTKQGVFSDEIGPTACQVTSGAENKRAARGLGEVKESLFSIMDETAEQLGQPIE